MVVDQTLLNLAAKAMCRNNFFYTCFNHNYPPLTDAAQDLDFTYGSLCPSHCPAQFPCKEESVLELLAGLDISKSTGSNGISPKMLKSTSLSMHCSIIYAGCSTSQYLLALFLLHGNWGELPQFPKAQTSPFPLATDQYLQSSQLQANSLNITSKQPLKNFYR